jgi:Tfp pilus assembly protein FimT
MPIHEPRSRRIFASLHEWLLATALIAVVTNLTVPSVSAMLRDAATSEEANELALALGAAREAAVARNGRVAVCGLSDPARPTCGGAGADWRHGWMVYAVATDGASAPEVLRVKRYSRADLGIRTDLEMRALSFLPDGSAMLKGESRFVIAVDGDTAGAREVVVTGMGRARITPRTPRG